LAVIGPPRSDWKDLIALERIHRRRAALAADDMRTAQHRAV